MHDNIYPKKLNLLIRQGHVDNISKEKVLVAYIRL